MNSEIQDEIEVLKSIYGSDFQDTKSTWANQTSFTIKSIPLTKSLHHDQQIYILLKFTLPPTYPKISPTIDVQSSAGLSTKQIDNIKSIIHNIINNMNGNIICYDIISSVVEYMESIGKPITLFDKMIKRQENETNQLKLIRKQNTTTSHINTLPISYSDLSIEGLSFGNFTEHENEHAPVSTAIPTVMSKDADEGKAIHKAVAEAVEEESDDDNAECEEEDDDVDVYVNELMPKTSKGDRIDLMNESASAPPPPPPMQPKMSRYSEEFEEMVLLGSGASGEVVILPYYLNILCHHTIILSYIFLMLTFTLVCTYV